MKRIKQTVGEIKKNITRETVNGQEFLILKPFNDFLKEVMSKRLPRGKWVVQDSPYKDSIGELIRLVIFDISDFVKIFR